MNQTFKKMTRFNSNLHFIISAFLKWNKINTNTIEQNNLLNTSMKSICLNYFMQTASLHSSNELY